MSEKSKKQRVLILVESPNKTKSITQLLKGTKYDGAVVMASVGHITQIENVKGSYYNTGIYPDKDFDTSYIISEDKKEIVNKLKEHVKYADVVYVCSDPDREGEAIAWSLKEFLKIPKTKFKRATFHEITKNAIINALDNPRQLDEELVDAAHSRQQLDKMLGYRLSSIARKSVGAKSVGRCQSAGLKLLADRESEINNFVPLEYGELILNFSKDKNRFKAKYWGDAKEVKQPPYNLCQDIADDCARLIEDGDWFKITNISSKDKSSNPKPPFTTSTFQQEVSSKLHVGVKDAMQLAQSLFEGIDVGGSHIALITYHRTDCAEFSKEFLPVLESYVKDTYGEKYYAPIKKAKKGENEQDGHEAIRPVDLSMTPEKLSKYITNARLLKVYEIIYKRTVATMMASSITSETIYEISCGPHKFNMISKELKFDGYKRVYDYKDTTTDDEIIKTTFNVGESIPKAPSPTMDLNKKQTQPPSRYKEATFIKELESSGIGRPSTFATITSTLLDESRGYCVVSDGCMVPTDKGMELSKYLDTSFPNLINIKYTSELEKDLDDIAKGKTDRLTFLKGFYTTLEDSVSKVKGSKTPHSAHKSVEYVKDITCPNCGAPMVLRTSKYGEFYGCSKYPKCKGIVKK